MEPGIASNVSGVLGSDNGGESKGGDTTSGFGESLKPQEPAPGSKPDMEEEL